MMKIEQVRQGTVMVLRPNAAVVEEDLEQLRRTVEELLSAGNVRLVLDLSDVPFIESEGLEALLGWSEEAARLGGGVRIAHPSDIARDVLIATHLTRRVEVFGEVEQARKSFL